MSEAIRVRARYDTPDENGKTRRERNADFGKDAPPLKVPYVGRYLWDWYFELSGSVRRIHEGVCCPIPPSEFIAWTQATKNIVYPSEYAILCEMDAAFCDETNKELIAYRARDADKRAKEEPKGAPNQRRRRGK